jgi:hypothetical protein
MHLPAPVIALAVTVSFLAAGPALAQQATVSDRECRQLVDYTASQDVNYRPGVDARGRPVAPADLPSPGGQIQAPQNFTFDLNTSLTGFGIPANSKIFEPQVGIGKITVEDGGRRVLFNGQPIGNSEKNAIAELCKQRQTQQPQTRPMTGPMKLN